MRQAGNGPNLNLVQSAHTRYPTSLLPHINQGKRWLLGDVMVDKVTLDDNLTALEFKLLVSQYPNTNTVKSASMLLLSKTIIKENVTRRT